MKRINSEISADTTHDLEVIKASLDELETTTRKVGIQLAANLIGAASEAISDELLAKLGAPHSSPS